MYNKNLPTRAGLTLEFGDGVKTFIEWVKGQRGHVDGDKIRFPCQKCKNTKFRTSDETSYHLCMRGFMPKYYNWTSHSKESVQDYFEAPTVPPVSEERTPTGHVDANYPQWNDEHHIDWAQRMVFDATRLSYFTCSHEGVPDDGTKSCPIDVYPSSYCYGGGSYDYDESGLADHFYNAVHAADHPLWNGTKLSRGRDPHQKKFVLRYVSLTLCLQRLYSSRTTADHMTWQATHQTEEGSICHPSDAMAWKHFDRMYPNFAEEPRNIRLGLCTDSFAPHD
ncbi:UNVERIFIED_CONTAM: hypothetical protein Scaly_2884600 [Sesamum calycinum]|uniref:Transposase-associated domain-containing protein n=1 Tax=Sesamum calycinum TaxID=2727403 RepID=A0AAW2LBP0_9LAMI